MSWPRTLFCRTTLVIASVSVMFQIFATGAIAYFALVPLGQRAADDLALRMVEVARTWATLPDGSKKDYPHEVWRAYKVRLSPEVGPLSESTKWLPFYYFVEHALTQHTGNQVTLGAGTGALGGQWLWADIPTERGSVRVGFSRERIGVYPPGALVLIMIVGAAATLVTSAYLARRLTAPLRRLSSAARRMGAGDCPEPLPTGGPEEFDTCVRSFNRMVDQVQELLASRTTLLAGISHDLRTPLARMRMALGLLSEGHDPALTAQLMQDVDAMNDLIGRCLELGRGFDEPFAEVDPGVILSELVGAARRAGNVVDYQQPPSCTLRLRPLAFQRVAGNLLDNALRYGGGQVPSVEFDADALVVRVLDWGAGIPEGEREKVFRPFHRLDPSRSNATGGSGLGLAIVRQLADANGWRVWLETRPGGGTVASIQLQVHEPILADCQPSTCFSS